MHLQDVKMIRVLIGNKKGLELNLLYLWPVVLLCLQLLCAWWTSNEWQL